MCTVWCLPLSRVSGQLFLHDTYPVAVSTAGVSPLLGCSDVHQTCTLPPIRRMVSLQTLSFVIPPFPLSAQPLLCSVLLSAFPDTRHLHPLIHNTPQPSRRTAGVILNSATLVLCSRLLLCPFGLLATLRLGAFVVSLLSILLSRPLGWASLSVSARTSPDSFSYLLLR